MGIPWRAPSGYVGLHGRIALERHVISRTGVSFLHNPNDTPTIPHDTYNGEYPMTKRKRHRSRCENDVCRRQFRHAAPAAKACLPELQAGPLPEKT